MNDPVRGVAVVSGAGSGIGREIALALAGRGHRLALLGRRLGPLETVLAASGAAGFAQSLDVRDAAAVEAAVRRASELGPVDVVVPAAGVARTAPFAELAAGDFDEVVTTNLLGVANLTRAALPGLRARDSGALVFLLSVAARAAFTGWSAYAASKWGLLGLVETLRVELAGSAVRVVAVSPGATDSPLWQGLPGDWDRSRMLPASEVAAAVVWALDRGPAAAVEEIRLRPPGGDL
jgi:NADP-dependent 3-hydroxy acid dehydrogenase YdfG